MPLTRDDVERELAEARGQPLPPPFAAVAGGADFHGRDVAGADLSGLDLRGSNFHGANLKGTNLTGCDLRGVNFHGAELADAVLNGAKLDEANLCRACLCRARLYNAVMRRANVSEACAEAAEGLDVREGDLKEANKAALRGDRIVLQGQTAKIYGERLREANLTGLSETHHTRRP